MADNNNDAAFPPPPPLNNVDDDSQPPPQQEKYEDFFRRTRIDVPQMGENKNLPSVENVFNQTTRIRPLERLPQQDVTALSSLEKGINEQNDDESTAVKAVVEDGSIEVETVFKRLPNSASKIMNGTDARLQLLALNKLADEFDDPQQTVDQAVMKRGQQSNDFYMAEQSLIDLFKELSGGREYDLSPDSVPLPLGYKKIRYKRIYAGHYPPTSQNGMSYTNKIGQPTCFTNNELANAINYNIPFDKQLKFIQMFDFWLDLTPGQVPYTINGKDYCHKKNFCNVHTKEEMELWHKLRINMLMWLIIDAINEGGFDGAYILLIGSNARELWPSMFEEAKEKAITYFKEEKNETKEFTLNFIHTPHYCAVLHKQPDSVLQLMDRTACQSQGGLIVQQQLGYFERTWSGVGCLVDGTLGTLEARTGEILSFIKNQYSSDSGRTTLLIDIEITSPFIQSYISKHIDEIVNARYHDKRNTEDVLTREMMTVEDLARFFSLRGRLALAASLGTTMDQVMTVLRQMAAWDRLTDEERLQRSANLSDGQMAAWDRLTDEERLQRIIGLKLDNSNLRAIENDRIWFRNFDECLRLMNINGGKLPSQNLKAVTLEGKNVRIGRWLTHQRKPSANSVNSERYRLLKEYKMLDPIIREHGETKNYKT
jgi:hypothetical protein